MIDRLNNNHRYTLTREWLGSGGILNWLMLNPSTADDKHDDPTIRKCCGFAKRWGYRGIIVTNLFAFRATKPADLWEMERMDFHRAIGERADEAIEDAVKQVDLVVVAWGAHQEAMPRANAVMNTVIPGVDLYCIGRTKEGYPLHPSRAPYTDAPIPFRVSELGTLSSASLPTMPPPPGERTQLARGPEFDTTYPKPARSIP